MNHDTDNTFHTTRTTPPSCACNNVRDCHPGLIDRSNNTPGVMCTFLYKSCNTNEGSWMWICMQHLYTDSLDRQFDQYASQNKDCIVPQNPIWLLVSYNQIAYKCNTLSRDYFGVVNVDSSVVHGVLLEKGFEWELGSLGSLGLLYIQRLYSASKLLSPLK